MSYFDRYMDWVFGIEPYWVSFTIFMFSCLVFIIVSYLVMWEYLLGFFIGTLIYIVIKAFYIAIFRQDDYK